MPNHNLTDLTASAAIAAMRRGDIKAEDYAAALLKRAQDLAALNAFRTLSPEAVLEQARRCDVMHASGAELGALHGLPIPIKDSVDTARIPTSNGTRALRDFTPRRDAEIIRRLLAQGAIVMGKTNLHELSRGYTCNNGAFGPVLNPHNTRHVPGGSSGGSAVAVAADIAPVTLAEDTLGSIRVPASLCGIAGLRPSFGRYSNQGVMSLTLGRFDQVGPLARAVSDLALFDAAVTNDSELVRARDLRQVRLGLSAELLSDLDEEVERITAEAIAKLRYAGATVLEAPLPKIVGEALRIASTVIAYENRTSIATYLAEQQTGLTLDQLLGQASPNIQSLYVNPPPARENHQAALARRAELTAALHEYFRTFAIDALLFPPTLTPAPTLGDNLEIDVRGRPMSIRHVMGRNTALGSVAGLPSLVLPAGVTRTGLPIGLEFAGPVGSDRALLSIGLSIQPVLGPTAKPRLG